MRDLLSDLLEKEVHREWAGVCYGPGEGSQDRDGLHSRHGLKPTQLHSLCFVFETGSHTIAQASLELYALAILMP